ncbi:structural protein [Cellulophaga phage phi48:2]|uniref:structural protein n=1 Tax=Cellulophaga phage phi48:2 TaxID=1327968 RepID=UPI0003519949|nr:structural protein [Cellulophaga phage phi48:2]AGO47255.1 structural protein [Cellulophaga phage phi48:2]
MLDTISFKLHGIKAVKDHVQAEAAHTNGEKTIMLIPTHAELFGKMMVTKNKYFTSRIRVQEHELVTNENDNEVEHNALSFLKESEKTEHLQIRDMIIFNDVKHTKRIYGKVNGKWEVPSSYHGVTYDINPERGFIEFQTSIPKYLYGNSLAQFVPNVDSKEFLRSYNGAHKISYQSKILHKRLTAFIKKFLEDLKYFFSLSGEFNLDYLEITRLDICFNQYFETRAKALSYLESLKILNYKRYGKNQKETAGYETSLTRHISDGSYFKIYHKGSEYRSSTHGDFSKHLIVNENFRESLKFNEKYQKVFEKHRGLINDIFEKQGEKKHYTIDPKAMLEIKEVVNKMYKKAPFKTEFFKKEMDKVLRYEVSLKGKWFSYTYGRKVFRAKCRKHNQSYLNYLKVKSIFDSRNSEKNLQYVSKSENNNYRMFNVFLNRKTAFVLGGNDYLKRFEQNGMLDYDDIKKTYKISKYEYQRSDLSTSNVGTFSSELLQFAIKHFYKLLKEFQVKTLTNYKTAVDAIKDYNDKVKLKVIEYNKDKQHLTIDIFGKPIIKGSVVIRKATQLLTQKELSELGLKKISPLILLTIMSLLKQKKSFRQIREEMGISTSQFSRYKKDLAMFDVSENTNIESEEIITCVDFSKYYFLQNTFEYREKCFLTPNLLTYG